jgi:hypothetical protein
MHEGSSTLDATEMSACGGSDWQLPGERKADLAIRLRLVRNEVPFTFNKIVKLLLQIEKEVQPAGSVSSSSSNSVGTGPFGGSLMLQQASVGDDALSEAGGMIKRVSSSGTGGSSSAASAPQDSSRWSGESGSSSGQSASMFRRLQGGGRGGIPGALSFMRPRGSDHTTGSAEAPQGGGGGGAAVAAVGAGPPSSSLLAHGLHMQHVHGGRGGSAGGVSLSSGAADKSGLAVATSVSSGLLRPAAAPALTTSDKSAAITAQGARRPGGLQAMTGVASSSAAPSVSFSATPSQTWMDVSLHMDGFFIRHAKLDLRLHRKSHSLIGAATSSSSHAFQTQLHQPQNPWVLDQVAQVAAAVSAQAGALERLERRQRTRQQEAQPLAAGELLEALAAAHALVKSLVESRNVLSSPSQECFPEAFRPSDRKVGNHFAPPPPRELVLQFSVHLGELIVSAYEVFFLNPPRDSTAMADQWTPNCDYTGMVFNFPEYKACVQVVDQVQVHFKVHSLQWLLECLYEAYNLAIRLLRKLEALCRHDLHLMLKDARSPLQQLEVQRMAEDLKRHSELPPLHHRDWFTCSADN